METKYQQAIKECALIARKYNETAQDWERLSGYTAHTKPGQYGGINFNGKEENAHESFILREHFTQNLEQDVHDNIGVTNNGSNFCKTARKPYDIVVTACLSVLKYRLGNAIDVSSDGTNEEWQAGVELARKVIKRKVPNPLGEVFHEKFERILRKG